MRTYAQAVPFVETECPDLFAHRIGRVELLSSSLVRLWWVVEEGTAHAAARYVLVGRILVPIRGILESQEMTTKALTAKERPPVIEGLAAVH